MEGRIPDISDRIYRQEAIKKAYESDISRPFRRPVENRLADAMHRLFRG